MTKEEYIDLFHKTQANLVAFKPLMECDDAVIQIINEAISEERERCASLDVVVTVPSRDYSDMSPKDIYEEAIMDAILSFRAAIREAKQND